MQIDQAITQNREGKSGAISQQEQPTTAKLGLAQQKRKNLDQQE